MALADASVDPPKATGNKLSPGKIGEQLRSFIDPARILTRPIDRIAFAYDASFYRLVTLVVVQPIGTTEVRQLFRYSRETHVPLSFRGSGTSLSGPAMTDGILVDVGRYWRSASVKENGRFLRAQSGLIGHQANLKRSGLPDDLDSANVFLASKSSRHITGQMLLVDGVISTGATKATV